MLNNKIMNRLGLSKLHLDKAKLNPSITVFDTSIGSLNVGDQIINQSASKYLNELFDGHQFIVLPTHSGLKSVGINRANIGDKRFVCGSNILNSDLLFHQQWNFSPWDFFRLEPLILLGVGWSNYQSSPTAYTKLVYNKRLDNKIIHSVRDNYTLNKLKEIGIRNVINTGCPTMWGLNKEHCSSIPLIKSKDVVFTLTDYRPDLENDSLMINILKSYYKNVYFWVQGNQDLSYFQSMDASVKDSINIIPPSLSSYEKLLKQVDSLDFIGTRLHAGIKALQNKKRTVIIGVDNRAIEKQKDFNLKVILRKNIKTELESVIDSSFKTEISINHKEIDEWMGQFK
ncbi:polysaccharide pyruvyl transferase family protein [Vibrio parahaemolyticus]|uniref:polysaccharide pyruvyl transferase family protein n=1 Tax=Vibrio parahaemolyticus TaxID=670 RepID=UPI0009AAC080|nr:polysaccharide pyruvyl transferase family protein [Vibrio parahaemolyticus]EHO8535992.1 polysaccharide pyruvyl transferase family protein [Vibrio parahaemolyticus]EIF2842172.1 polysaccharide pyruvyl transferase family protein [Vibrio parahaemolyticus]EIJ2228718.1 polysaccharide pyruvyl transferase family protein [Vibrio parahaemolyticus]